MKIQKTTEKEKQAVLQIYSEAKTYFKENGIDQWQNGYPNEESLDMDCEQGISYIIMEEEKVLGTAVIMADRDKTYDTIYEGSWLSQGEKYGVMHRVAVSGKEKGRGIAGELFSFAENYCALQGAEYMRIDTHEDNLSMQRRLAKSGFNRCGVIYLEDGAKRIAFEKKI